MDTTTPCPVKPCFQASFTLRSRWSSLDWMENKRTDQHRHHFPPANYSADAQHQPVLEDHLSLLKLTSALWFKAAVCRYLNTAWPSVLGMKDAETLEYAFTTSCLVYSRALKHFILPFTYCTVTSGMEFMVCLLSSWCVDSRAFSVLFILVLCYTILLFSHLS